MKPFTKLTTKIIPLPYRNIDTDQIIPARYLKVTDKAGLADGLFYDWRYLDDDSELDPPARASDYPDQVCFDFTLN